MKFFVNFLSAFRIAAAFAIIPTLMLGWYWTSLVLFIVAAATDFFDGYLAKKYDVVSKIGGVMDHIGDKLLVANTLIMLAIMMPVWFVVIPIILLIARELYISGLREFLGTQKMEMPVPSARFSMGKVKTTFQMLTCIAFLGLFATTTLMNAGHLNATTLRAMNWLSQAGIIGLWISLVASLWSATQYTRTFAEKIKKLKK